MKNCKEIFKELNIKTLFTFIFKKYGLFYFRTLNIFFLFDKSLSALFFSKSDKNQFLLIISNL